MAGIIGPTCKSEGEAIAAATAIAGAKAPKGMKAKVSVTGVNKVGDLFAASVAIEFVPETENELEGAGASVTDTDEGKGETGKGDTSKKTGAAPDVYALTAAQRAGLDANPNDPSVIQNMEQLPDPDQNLLVAEVQDAGPQSAEAVAMAEEMKTEFNDRPLELLVVGNSATTPSQHASNLAHNQRELDAEETRREQAQANAAQSQKEALTPDVAA